VFVFVAGLAWPIAAQDMISPDEGAVRMGASPADRIDAARERFEKADNAEEQAVALADFEKATQELLESQANTLHGVPLFDNDVFKLAVRFAFDLIFVFLVVHFAYFKNRDTTKNNIRTNVFSFLMMNIVVFFLCFALKKLEVELGLALGLFAIFTILRFRTDAIGIREMTYLFVAVGIAVINALSNRKTSYVELIFANTVIVAFALLLEKALAPLTKIRLARQSLVYDKMDLIKPQSRQELIDDLSARLGYPIKKAVIKKVNLASGSCTIDAYYESTELDSDEENGNDTNDEP
jgi:hypothetical protein